MTRDSAADLLIRSDELEAAVSPEFGGGITRLCHLATGADLLWRTPWAEDTPPPPSDRSLGVDAWVRHSRGGWQVLLPNGGDACDHQGVRHGFHGEASVSAWTVSPPSSPGGHDARSSVTLEARLTAAPLDVERTITVSGADLVVHESITNRSSRPADLIWTHHPGLGGDLLAGPVTIDTNARTVTLDDRAAVAGVEAAPGDRGRWPLAGSGARPVDLRSPVEGSALLAYLSGFDGAPWVSVLRDDGSLGIRLVWDGRVFPYCWLWQELGGTDGPPWHGRVRVLGVEPSTSWPGQGLARVASTTGTTFRLAGTESISTSVTLSVFAGADDSPAIGEPS